MLVINQAREYLVDFEIATNPKYEPNWHHERIAEELEHIAKYGDRDYKILILSVPPRHGKSKQATIDFPAWLLGNLPDKEVITASYSAELATDFGTQTRELIQSEAYHAIFDTRLKADQKAKGRWKIAIPDDKGRMKATGGGYTSIGIGGAATGRGADVFIVDDPIKNREEADSEVYRDRVWNWFISTAWTRLHPKGVMIVIMTRWNMDDLVGRIMDRTEELGSLVKIKLLRFKAIADKDSKRRKEGQALWPERYSLDNLLATKSLIGPYEFQCTPEETPILMADWTFKPIKEVIAGDEVVGFVNGKGRGTERSRLCVSKVKRVFSKEDDVYALKMESGRTVKCTQDHRWYNGRIEGAEAKGNYKGRNAYTPAKIGRPLMFAVEHNQKIIENTAAWNYLAGIIDGEGHIGANTLMIGQTCEGSNEPVYRKIKSTLDILGISYNETIETRNPRWKKFATFQIHDPRNIYIKLLQLGVCAKSNQMVARLFEKSHHPIKEEDKVLSISFERRDNVYALETETGNYIAWGYISSNSLYQGSPILAGDREFKEEWIRPITEEALSLMNTRNFLTVDTAMSKKAQADFCGFCDNRVNKENFWHFMAWRMKIGPEELVDTLFTLHAKNRYEKIGIEKTAYLDGLKPYLDSEQRKRNVFLPIVELEHKQTAKEIRVRSLIPRYASGSVFHVTGRCDALEEEMTQFPSGVHDDVIDATAYQSQIVTEGSRGIKAQGPKWKGYNKR